MLVESSGPYGTLLLSAYAESDDGSSIYVRFPKGSRFALNMLQRPDVKLAVDDAVKKVFGARTLVYSEGDVSAAPVTASSVAAAAQSASAQAAPAVPAPTPAPAPAPTPAPVSEPISTQSAAPAAVSNSSAPDADSFEATDSFVPDDYEPEPVDYVPEEDYVSAPDEPTKAPEAAKPIEPASAPQSAPERAAAPVAPTSQQAPAAPAPQQAAKVSSLAPAPAAPASEEDVVNLVSDIFGGVKATKISGDSGDVASSSENANGSSEGSNNG